MDPVRQVAEILDGPAGVRGCSSQRIGPALGIVPRFFDPHEHLDEPLLRTVVQVTSYAPAFLVGGLG